MRVGLGKGKASHIHKCGRKEFIRVVAPGHSCLRWLWHKLKLGRIEG